MSTARLISEAPASARPAVHPLPYVLVAREAVVGSLRGKLAVVPAADRDLVANELTHDRPDDALWRVPVEGQPIERWPMAVVFDNLIACALTLLERRRKTEGKPPGRGALHHDEITQVIDRMRRSWSKRKLT